MYETIALKLFDTGLAAVGRRLDQWWPKNVARPSVITKDAEAAVRRHINLVERWASSISFRDMGGSRPLDSTFVELDLNVSPARLRGDALPDRTYKVSELLTLERHIAVLGDPGAGKTTSLKKTAASLLKALESESELAPSIPVLLRFREFGPDDSLVDWIASLLGLHLVIPPDASDPERRQMKRQLIAELLDQSPITLLLDGLDEAPAQSAEYLVQELRNLLLLCGQARIVISCRSGAFPFDLDNCRALELSPLSRQQIDDFAQRWLGSKESDAFLEQIASSPYAGTEVRPLTLAHLCAIYLRSGRVPDQPKTVYRMVVRLLLEEWDAQRSVRRTSRYANFEADRKEEFLEALSFNLSIEGVRGRFSHSQLRSAYLKICEDFSLPRSEGTTVAREIESHAGLIVESGREEYEYAHKSIQEYLTAQYILKLPGVPEDPEIFWAHPNELALAVALSSRPTDYLLNVLTIFLQQCDSSEDLRSSQSFVSPLFQRLATERVTFNANYLLGLCILATLSEYLPKSRTKKLVLGSTPVAFLHMTGVMESIELFRQKTQAHLVEPGVVELNWENSFELGDRTLRVLEMLGFPESIRIDQRLLALDKAGLENATTLAGHTLVPAPYPI